MLTRFGGAAADGAAVAVATSAGFDGAVDRGVADVKAAEGGLYSGAAAEVFGADTSRVTAIELGGAEVADDFELKEVVGGGAALVVGEPLAHPWSGT